MKSTKKINNWIDGKEVEPSNNLWLPKYNPHSGILLSEFADSANNDVDNAVYVAKKSYDEWSQTTPVKRGLILQQLVNLMRQNTIQLADCVAVETGKSPIDALGEVNAALQQAEYWSSEGMRLHGRSLTSSIVGKYSHTVRHPIGVAGLIVPANTPIANITWKTFPALICGNTVVLKAAEDAPEIALKFAKLTKEAGLPDGVFNVIQGSGKDAGASIVTNADISLISFTGSTQVGKWIAEVGGSRLARISLELGGKNPFVVCDDANIDLAVQWASLSAFSNAGQRCAAGSRILIFKNVYDEFRNKLIKKAKSLKIGIKDGCDLGPVINKRQHSNILNVIHKAKEDGGDILCGGRAPEIDELSKGYYIYPTLVEGLEPSAELSCKEIFGPVATMHKVSDLYEALHLANETEYGLTSAIHTTNVDRAMWFAQRVKAGVANINLGTFGSEPHMPFGGFGASGNGTREPGLEALNVYSEIKNISFLTRSNLI